MIKITLQKIRDHSPCADGWRTLLESKAGLAYDVEFPLSDVLSSNGFDDALWCLRCLPEHSELWRKYAVWCARRVQHLMTDLQSLAALDAAWDAAWAAAWAAARDAAWDAAWTAAWDAALDAARDAAREAALDAAGAAAWDAAREAARGAHEKKLREILTAGEWV